MIEFTVPGQPVAQARPKFARRGSFTVAYDPAKCKDYKSWVKTCAIQEMDRTGHKPYDRDAALALSVIIFLQRPKSSKKDALPTKKPDCDNVLKGIQDALESICYVADQQIISVSVTKVYVDSDPRVSVVIREIIA